MWGHSEERKRYAAQLADLLKPMMVDDVAIDVYNLASVHRLLTVEDFCMEGAESTRLLSEKRKPYLLTPDPLTKGEVRKEEILSGQPVSRLPFIGAPDKYWVTTHYGDLLLDGDTAVWWL